MEIVSRTLQPYKELVANLAGALTILQFFAGIVVCRDIHKNGSTKGFSPMPFIGGVAIGILFLQYGVILEDRIMILVNLVAIFLNLLYTVFFYVKSEDKKNEVLKPIAYAVALDAVLLGYARSDTPDNVEFSFGFILTALMLFLMGMPLLDVKEIIKRKDASSIPFPMTFMGTIVTFFWLLYGVILQNNFMIVQNAIGVFLCSFQLVLIVIYRPRTRAVRSKKQQ
ncbi:unnamed protein product [Ceutorhynchus assimilis]|uniref:Sugar transporter SWEET n=1 Tax=Ceutorhynchus assimilis TaxID=467358 RepID=A0A9N9MEK9_9CUCU|nr:unnamed protein product [Ceutorhynchus assimilis]